MPITRRRLYVNNLSSQIGTPSAPNPAAQTTLINFGLAQNIDTFLYYDIKSYLQSSQPTFAINGPRATILGDFLLRARNSGINHHVAVMGGYYENSNNTRAETEVLVIPYGNKVINAFHTSQNYIQKRCFFNKIGGEYSGLNLELEYWWDHTLSNGTAYPNGVTAYGYQQWLNTGNLVLETIGNFRVWNNIIYSYKKWKEKFLKPQAKTAALEAYIGFFNPTGYELQQATAMINNLNTILVHAYRAPANISDTTYTYAQRIWAYVMTRLNWIGLAQQAVNPATKMNISLIYSFEGCISGQDVFSCPWFSAHPGVTMDNLHTEVENAFNASTFPGKQYINIEGWTIFTYTMALPIL